MCCHQYSILVLPLFSLYCKQQKLGGGLGTTRLSHMAELDLTAVKYEALKDIWIGCWLFHHLPHSMSALICTQFAQISTTPQSGWSVGRPLQTISLRLPSTNKCTSPSLVNRRPTDCPARRSHMLVLIALYWSGSWSSWYNLSSQIHQ